MMTVPEIDAALEAAHQDRAHYYDMANRTAAAYLDTCSEADKEAHDHYCLKAEEAELNIERLWAQRVRHA